MSDDKIITCEKARVSGRHQPSVMKQKDRKLEAIKAAFKASREEVGKRKKTEESLAERRKRNKKKRDGKKK